MDKARPQQMRQACRPTQRGRFHGVDTQQGLKGPPPRGLWGQWVEASESVPLPVRGSGDMGPVQQLKARRAGALGTIATGQLHSGG